MTLASTELLRFMQAGGPVLWVVYATGVLIAGLVFNQVLTLRMSLCSCGESQSSGERLHVDPGSWWGHVQRRSELAAVEIPVRQSLLVIRGLVAACPCLGLLGTVLGMMRVFDVLATDDVVVAGELGAAIAWATLPTLAGMSVALCGLAAVAWLEWELERRLIRTQSVWE